MPPRKYSQNLEDEERKALKENLKTGEAHADALGALSELELDPAKKAMIELKRAEVELQIAKYRRRLSQLDVYEREGRLIPYDIWESTLVDIASVLRRLAKTLQKNEEAFKAVQDANLEITNILSTACTEPSQVFAGVEEGSPSIPTEDRDKSSEDDAPVRDGRDHSSKRKARRKKI